MEPDVTTQLAEVLPSIGDDIQHDDNQALFALGVKMPVDDESPLSTYINVVGLYEILAEGLYQELNDFMSNGNLALFSIFRDVIRTLEEEYEISPDEDLEELEKIETLH